MAKTTEKAKTSAPDLQTEAEQGQRQQRQQVATLQPARLPYHPVYQERYGIDGMMWRALVEAVYPAAKTVEGIILAVSYCKSKNYDVMKKFVHVVPIWNSALGKEVEGVWEGVAALRATAFRTGEYAGCDKTEFGPLKTMHFEGVTGKGQYEKKVSADVTFPEWAQVTVYRLVQGVRCAFPGPKVYWLAAYGCQGKSDVPNDKWQEGGGSYMLEKCTEAAALRKAFPEDLGSINAAEEMEGRKFSNMGAPTIDHEPPPPRPTRESVQAADDAAANQAQELKDAEARAAGRMPDHDEDGVVIEEEDHRDEGGEDDRSDDEGGKTDAKTKQETGKPAAEQSDQGQKAKETKAPPAEKKPAAPNYAEIATKIIDKMKGASKRRLFDAVVEDWGPEIDQLKAEAPDEYAAVQKAIKERISWFER